MNEMQTTARQLLESGQVSLIIGYEQSGSNQVRAAFISNPDDTGRLIFDTRCVQNIAVYITKKEVLNGGKTAIIAPLPVMRSLIQLAVEKQVSDETIQVIGLTSDLQVKIFNNLNEVAEYIKAEEIRISTRDEEIMNRLETMSAEERWDFWKKTLEPCFKCYACRASCPLCYCTQCTVEQNRPQWVPVASHSTGNLEWHVMRAMHMAGRCTGCDACARACPVGIPINLLNYKIKKEITVHFGESHPSLHSGNTMSTFKPDDVENFIR